MFTVTAYISTCGRYFTTLPLAIMSVANQTYKPKHFILYDDGEQKDLRKDNLYLNIFACLDRKGITWEVKFGGKLGQTANHDKAIDDSNTDLIWRLDDDNVAESDCLEKLVKHFEDEKVGGVAGLVYHPDSVQDRPWFASSKIEDTFDLPTIQWFKQPTNIEEVDHFYSTFIYRKKVVVDNNIRYKHKELSKVGHREETIFSHEIKRAGFKLLVDTSAVTWHFRCSTGGIRQGTAKEMWDHDDEVFKKYLNDWDVVIRKPEIIVLDSGLGDHIVFKKILPEIRAKYKKLILAVCYSEVFEDDKDITIISINEAKKFLGNIEDHNIYKFMWDRNWTKSLAEAFRERYLK